jgi:taurine transport system substrate-binding protein
MGGFPVLSRAATTLNYGGSAWLGHYPVYVGWKAGIFSNLGIDLHWQSFGTSSARMGAVMSGNLDVAGTGVVSALALMASGAKQFQLISTVDDFGKSEGLLVHGDVKTITDLRGKKVGVTYASSSHVLLLDALKQAGLEPGKDVMLINLPAPDLLSAYKGKQIDAAAAWTPTFDRIKVLPDTKILLDDSAFSLFKQYGITPGPDVLIVRTAFATGNAKTVKDFLAGVAQANALMTQKPEEAAKMLIELTNLSPEEQLTVIKQTQWYDLAQQRKMFLPVDGKPSKFIDGVQKLADMLVDLKQIDSAPRVQDWVNASYL